MLASAPLPAPSIVVPASGTSPARPQEEPSEIRALREELQAKERVLESLRRGAVDHLSLIEALERETFLKEESVHRLQQTEAVHKQVKSLMNDLRAKDEDVDRLRLQASSADAALKVLDGESKGKADLVESLVCAMTEENGARSLRQQGGTYEQYGANGI